MCARRSKRNTNEKGIITEKKRKKQGCCRRCRRRICRWLSRKLKRCIKRKVFGDSKLRLSDYEIAGMSFGNIKNKFKKTNLSKLELNSQKFESKKSVVTLFRQHLSKAKIAIKNIDLIEGLNPIDLKKKYSITGSKTKILENMLDDYNGGKLSLTWLSHKSALRPEKLDKQKLNKMLHDYDEARKKKVDASLKNFLNNADVLKKKFSLSGSNKKVLDKMIEDYKKGVVSLSMLPIKHKLDPKKMDKEEIKKVLEDYSELQKNKNITTSKFSKLKQLQSVILNEVKNVNFSFTGLSKKLFKN